MAGACEDLCDIDGLPLHAAGYFAEEHFLKAIRAAKPTDFVLIDEVQDCSTLELSLIRQLVPDADAENAFFFVGDPNQKMYPKHHLSTEAGFDFRGKATPLCQNFRNTKQILRAAKQIPSCYPPQTEELFEVMDPELSPFEGGLPFAIRCTRENHLATVMAMVEQRRGNRTAVVSDNVTFLAEIRQEAQARGFRCYELFRNEEIDHWREQEGDSLSASLVVSRMEAVKGFEFDTLIACDLSEGTVPRSGLPEEEYWRHAAIVYCALTRARDELLMTYIGKPSVFINCMGELIGEIDASRNLGER